MPAIRCVSPSINVWIVFVVVIYIIVLIEPDPAVPRLTTVIEAETGRALPQLLYLGLGIGASTGLEHGRYRGRG